MPQLAFIVTYLHFDSRVCIVLVCSFLSSFQSLLCSTQWHSGTVPGVVLGVSVMLAESAVTQARPQKCKACAFTRSPWLLSSFYLKKKNVVCSRATPGAACVSLLALHPAIMSAGAWGRDVERSTDPGQLHARHAPYLLAVSPSFHLFV